MNSRDIADRFGAATGSWLGAGLAVTMYAMDDVHFAINGQNFAFIKDFHGMPIVVPILMGACSNAGRNFCIGIHDNYEAAKKVFSCFLRCCEKKETDSSEDLPPSEISTEDPAQQVTLQIDANGSGEPG